MPSLSKRELYVQGFFQAAISGEENDILEYVKDGFDVNTMQEYDELGKKVSALMLASEYSHSDCVEALLRFGADISQLTQHYTKAIVYASRQNMPECLKTLAAVGMYRKEGCEDPMFQYKEFTDHALQGNFDKVRSLVSESDYSRRIGQDGLWVNTLCFLVLCGCPRDHIEHVIKTFGIDVNDCCSRGFTPLISAIISGDVEMVDFLIGKGANVNKVEDFLRNAQDIECKWVKEVVKFAGSEESDKDDDDYLPFSSVLNSDGKSPLMYAVWAGRLNVVKRLLKVEDLDIGRSDSQQCGVLAHAVHVGRTDILDEVLSHGGANINERNSDKRRTVLFVAVDVENEDILKRILSAGVDANAVDGFGLTAMLYAAETGRVKSLKVLLEAGGLDINSIDHGRPQNTALMYAAHNVHYDCLRLLLDHGADMDISNADGQTVFDVAAEFGDVNCVKMLIERSQNGSGSSSSSSNHEHELRMGKTVHQAAKNKNIEVLKLIVPFCKDINATDDSDLTALMHATNSGHIENIKLLLQNGADVNVQNDDGVTAIWLALYAENLSCFELYIEAGADVGYVPVECDSLLICAAEMEDEDNEYLQILLQKGAGRYVNTVCKYSGTTPLITAAKHDRLGNLEVLLDNGADVNIPDKNGMTAAMYAARWPEGLRLLIKAGANLDAVDNDEDSLWFLAVRKPECLKILLEDGSVFDKESTLRRRLKRVHGESAFSTSFSWHVESLILLFEYGVFDWDWFVYGEQIEEIDRISFAALNVANNCPVQFENKDKRNTSLLQEAFLGHDIRTVRYLLANLFLTIEDYKTIVSDSDFQRRMREVDGEADEPSETLAYFNRISCQPWRLETLSFLAISSSVKSSLSNYQQSPSRSDQVDTLALPQVLKSKLKYESAVRKLCPSEWESIGILANGQEEDLLAVIKPLYPHEQDLTECDAECSLCSGHGYISSL